MPLQQALEGAYVAGWRAARVGAERAGVLERLESRDGRGAAHLRSLFAIHDVADMIHLDLAWWTYDAIATVEEHLAARGGQARVFEYGAGASSAWLARRAHEVTSVEHDEGFADFLDTRLDPSWSVDLRVVPPTPSEAPAVPSQRRGQEALDFSRYVHAIDDVPGGFDLVVVDGRARVACARHALGRLAPDGLMLLDNANRAEYAPVVTDPSLDVRVTRGATPCLPYPTSTALIRRR